MAAGVAAAAALPSLDLACGLGTVGLLDADVTRVPLLPDGGTLPVGAVQADPVLLAELAAPPDRYAWWAERIRRCHGVMVQRVARQANDPVAQR
jgi:O-succinylbenzoate synthase